MAGRVYKDLATATIATAVRQEYIADVAALREKLKEAEDLTKRLLET